MLFSLKNVKYRNIKTKSKAQDTLIPIIITGFILRSSIKDIQSDFFIEKSLFSTFSVTSSELYSDALGISERVRNTGSGFFLKYKNNVYAITNSHVVNQALNTYVHNKKISDLSPVKIIYENVLADLAILEVENKDISTLSICNTTPHIGEDVFVIGDPYRLEGSVSAGIISRIDESFIQTDAAVNPGSSGGPLISKKGQCLLGVITARSEGDGISFAIPSSVVIENINDLKDHVVH